MRVGIIRDWDAGMLKEYAITLHEDLAIRKLFKRTLLTQQFQLSKLTRSVNVSLHTSKRVCYRGKGGMLMHSVQNLTN